MEHRSAEEMEATTERLLEDLKAVLDDGEQLLRAGAQNLSERGLAARARLTAALEVAREIRRKLQGRARTEQLLPIIQDSFQILQQLLRAGAQNLSERGLAARARLTAALEVAREIRRKLQGRARTGVKVTDRAIRDHPYEAIGIAFGIGVVIGAILNRE